MEGIQVSTEAIGKSNQISVIKVGGYIDTTTSSEVERALNGLLRQGRFQIVIDLGNVDYISSAGWGIFISEIKAIRENSGDLKLVRMIPDVYEIFELLEFHHILDVYDSIDEAVNSFEESQYVTMVSEPQTHAGTQYAQEQPAQPQPAQQTVEQPPHTPEQTSPMEQPQPQPHAQPGPQRRTVLDLVNMTIEDKIKYVVAHEPESGAFKINKRLNSADFGFTKIGWFGVRSMLNKLGLNSRKKRLSFARNYH